MSKLKPPYPHIYSSLIEGKVIPFLGAGTSLIGRDPTVGWKFGESQFLPSGEELARYLADDSGLTSEEPQELRDLAKVASYYDTIIGREDLREHLRKIMLNDNYQHSYLHAFLASLPAPLIIVVTNYDTLLEQAFLAQNRPYDLIVYLPTSDSLDNPGQVLWWKEAPNGPLEYIDPLKLPELIDLSTTPIIFKMHGTVVEQDSSRDKFVITEEDYIDFLSRMVEGSAIPNLILSHFQQRRRRFIFLGYSLRDWNLRVILNDIKNKTNKPVKSWAILRESSDLDQKLWGERGVEIFDASLEEFELAMQEENRKAEGG